MAVRKRKRTLHLSVEEWKRRAGLTIPVKRLPKIRRQKKALPGQLNLFDGNTASKEEART